jgi:hypothetical protein
MTYTTQQFRANETRKFIPARRKLSVPFWAIMTTVAIVSFVVTYTTFS